MIELIYILAIGVFMVTGTILITVLWLWWKAWVISIYDEWCEVMDRAWYWVLDKVLGEHTDEPIS